MRKLHVLDHDCNNVPKAHDTLQELDAVLLVAQAAADQLALQLGFKGYAELEREEPFFDASTAVRNQQVRPKSTFPSAPATRLLHASLFVWCMHRIPCKSVTNFRLMTVWLS